MSVERVDKPWGYELRFAMTERYAGKVLFIRAGHQLSLQYHRLKDEAFYVQQGVLDLVLGNEEDRRVERLSVGDSRHLVPGTVPEPLGEEPVGAAEKGFDKEDPHGCAPCPRGARSSRAARGRPAPGLL